LQKHQAHCVVFAASPVIAVQLIAISFQAAGVITNAKTTLIHYIHTHRIFSVF
jgi:hypothetical protein